MPTISFQLRRKITGLHSLLQYERLALNINHHAHETSLIDLFGRRDSLNASLESEWRLNAQVVTITVNSEYRSGKAHSYPLDDTLARQ